MIQSSLSKKPMPWFALFNFVIYTSVFLGRILRDSLLFSQEGGEMILPAVFIINAVVISWVADNMGAWEEKLKREKYFISVYGLSAIFFMVIGVLLHPYITDNIFTSPLYKTGVAFVFYFVAEVPIFLCVNIIWIIAADYFTEQDGQKEYPKISAIGLLGIAVASFVFIINGFVKLPLNYFVFLWALLCIALLFISITINNKCKKIKSIDDSDYMEEEEEEVVVSFWENAKRDYKWVKKHPFLWLFTIVTVCNFLLLAIFDQTLANGASNLGIEGGELSLLIASFTFGFGLFAAGFQWFVFPKLLNKKGVAKLNLYAPRFMILGAASYLIFASDFFEPIWKIFNFSTNNYLLQFVILARIMGWCAEFLFNQSMLPFVYGALPSQDENRGRLFVEGPVTAITNGVVGFFLLGYFFLFAQKSEGYGIKLDFLFVIAAFAAVLMYIWSKQMIPTFRKVLKERALEGEGTDKMLMAFRPDLMDDIGLIEDEIEAKKIERKDLNKSIKLLVLSNGPGAIPVLKNIILDVSMRSGDKEAAIVELAKLKAVDSFKEILDVYDLNQSLPHFTEIKAIGMAGKELGFTSEIKKLFTNWLYSFNPNYNQASCLLKGLGGFGLDGALIVGEYIENFHTKKITSSNLNKNDFYLLAAEMGTERFYPLLAETARKKRFSDWSSISKIDFFDKKHVIDAFSLLLPKVEDINDGAAKSLIKLVGSHNWLFWPLVWILETSDSLAENLKFGRHLWPRILSATLKNQKNKDSIADFNYNSFAFFDVIKDKISSEIAPELCFMEWEKCSLSEFKNRINLVNQPNEGIRYFDYLIGCVEKPDNYSNDVGCYISYIECLYELSEHKLEKDVLEISTTYALDEFRKLSIYFYMMDYFDNSAVGWLKRRRKQWLECYLMLLGCIDPDIKESVPKNSASALLYKDNRFISEIDKIRKDKTLTMIEQSGIGRNLFSALRSDLENMETYVKNFEIREKYLNRKIKFPSNKDDADLIWREYVGSCNDELLKESLSGINMEVLNVS